MLVPCDYPASNFTNASQNPYANEGEETPSKIQSTAYYPMPTPQPFKQGSVVYGHPTGHPEYPPIFHPSYGGWQNQSNVFVAPSHSWQPSDTFFQEANVRHESPVSISHPDQFYVQPHLEEVRQEDEAPRPLCRPQSPSDGGNGGSPAFAQGSEARELNADDIKPNVYHFSHLSNALQELETCKTIFEQCDDKLVNELMVVFRKESLEFQIQSKTGELKDASAAAFKTAHDIHDGYQAFAQTIVGKLRVVSQSNEGGLLFPDEGLNELWKNIDELSLSIKKSSDSLRSCIYDLTRLIAQTKDKYERRHLRKKLWEWLVRFFEAIARALGFAQNGIMAGLGRAGLVGAAVGASRRSLAAAAQAVCRDIEKFNLKQEQGFLQVLKFLEDELPTSLKKAELSLTNFNAFREVQQVELVDKKDSLSGKMTAGEAKRALRDWESLCRTRA